MYSKQVSIVDWMEGRLLDLADLRKRRVSDREIIKMAIEGKARLSRNEVRELSYKSASRGQFFTPEPIADLVSFLAEIKPNETVLDPACGLGDLMFSALAYSKNVEGIELMSETAQLASRVLGLNVKQGNSLEMLEKLKMRSVVLANPPFGNIKGGLTNWDSFILNKGKKSTRLEILFLELCMRIAKRRVIMIAPNSLLSCNRDLFARKWLLENFGYRASIDLPHKTFWKSTRHRNKWTTPATTTHTSIMVIDKVKPKGNYKVFMAILEKLEDFEKTKEAWSSFRRKNP